MLIYIIVAVSFGVGYLLGRISMGPKQTVVETLAPIIKQTLYNKDGTHVFTAPSASVIGYEKWPPTENWHRVMILGVHSHENVSIGFIVESVAKVAKIKVLDGKEDEVFRLLIDNLHVGSIVTLYDYGRSADGRTLVEFYNSENVSLSRLLVENGFAVEE